MGRTPVGHPRSAGHQGGREGAPSIRTTRKNVAHLVRGFRAPRKNAAHLVVGTPKRGARQPPPATPFDPLALVLLVVEVPQLPTQQSPTPWASSHIVVISGTIAAQGLSGIDGPSSSLVTQPAPAFRDEAKPGRNGPRTHRPNQCNLHRFGRWRRCSVESEPVSITAIGLLLPALLGHELAAYIVQSAAPFGRGS